MICPIGSVWVVGFSSTGVGGRPIVLFKDSVGQNDEGWAEHRSLIEGEIITVIGEDLSDEGWMRVLVSSGDVGYVWRGRLLSARRLDEER